MRLRFRLASGIAVATLLAGLGSARVLAQDAVAAARDDEGAAGDDGSRRARARARFEEGVRLTEEGRWADALAAFRESWSIRRAPVALLNIGIALRSLGRFVEASDTFRSYLLRFEGQRPQLDEQARTYREEVLRRVARVRVRVTPGNAELLVDGRPRRGEREDGETVLRVDPGQHVIAARAQGYTQRSRSIVLDSGDEQSLALRLEPVRSGGVSAWVWVAGGAVLVAGGVVATVLLTQSSASYPPTTYVAAGTLVEAP